MRDQLDHTLCRGLPQGVEAHRRRFTAIDIGDHKPTPDRPLSQSRQGRGHTNTSDDVKQRPGILRIRGHGSQRRRDTHQIPTRRCGQPVGEHTAPQLFHSEGVTVLITVDQGVRPTNPSPLQHGFHQHVLTKTPGGKRRLIDANQRNLQTARHQVPSLNPTKSSVGLLLQHQGQATGTTATHQAGTGAALHIAQGMRTIGSLPQLSRGCSRTTADNLERLGNLLIGRLQPKAARVAKSLTLEIIERVPAQHQADYRFEQIPVLANRDRLQLAHRIHHQLIGAIRRELRDQGRIGG